MHKLTAIELRNQFQEKKVSAKEIVDYFYKRIRASDPKLKAFLSLSEKSAYDKAKELDERKDKNLKCAAIPCVIKDNMHKEGEITTCASQFLTNYVAPFSATAVRSLEEEGAIILGKTNLDEFAMGSSTENSSFFSTKNPWDLSCVPGGSSGGSAAAVSARLALMATGSDTGGSIRQPAALCGIVGFKPTYGRVSRYGLVAFGSSLDQIGPLTANVSDAALMMEVMGKHCPKDATSLRLPSENYLGSLKTSLKGIKLGVPWAFVEGLDAESEKNFKDSIKILQNLGAEVIDVNLDLLKYSVAVYYIIATAEASTNLARFDGIRYGVRAKEAKTLEEIYDLSRKNGFGPEVKRRIMLGTYVLSKGFQDAYYKKAQKVRTLIINAFDIAFEKCNLVIIPTSPTPTFTIGEIQDPLKMYLQDIYTIPANLAGLPALSVPSGFTKKEKPLALQFIGPQLHDVSVLSCGYAFELAVKQTKIPKEFF